MPVRQTSARSARRRWLIAALCSCVGFMAAPLPAQDSSQQDRRVCVATSGGGWQCGSASNPPSAPERVPEAPPPPVFLADPRQAGQPGSPFAAPPEFRGDVVGIEPTGAPAATQGFIPGISAPGTAPVQGAPARARPATASTETAAAPAPSQAAPGPAASLPPRPARMPSPPMVGISPAAEPLRPARPAPAATAMTATQPNPPTRALSEATEPARDPVAEQAPEAVEPAATARPATPLVVAEPEAVASTQGSPVDDPAPTVTSPPVEPAASRSASLASAEPRNRPTPPRAANNDAFLGLDGSQYGLQLLSSADQSAVLTAAERYAIDMAALYVLEIRRDGQAWWLLLWAPFPDADSARDALGRLADAPATSVWPRRIAPLQNEARRVTQ